MKRAQLVAVLGLVALYPALLVGQVRAQEATAVKASVKSDIYQNWLNEDVAYIIAPEERAAFTKLTSDAEREQFVIQFWIRRDPTPHTAENEFKEEHYRRLAYSNVHFADSRPGWQSDRGHVYIVDGPPEEIRGVPAKAEVEGGPKHAVQIWKYGSGKEFQFVDNCDCGRYELDKPLEKWIGKSTTMRTTNPHPTEYSWQLVFVRISNIVR